MAEIKGDLTVCNVIDAERRLNEGLETKTITTTEQLATNSKKFQVLTASTAQDVVLPDATDLTDGWEVTIKAITSTLTVQTYHSSTPVDLKDITRGRIYTFTLLDNSTAAGDWAINFLEESDKIPSARYAATFNATTDWGTASGGKYTYTVTAATHGRGVSPSVLVEELSGTDYIRVFTDEMKINSTGDVSISVISSPNCRFAGRITLV